MFEQTLQEMTASIYIHPDRYQMLTASNVGVNSNLIFSGEHIYTMEEAVDAIKSIDKALLSCPKYLRKKILSERNMFVFAFGPEMEEFIGVAH